MRMRTYDGLMSERFPRASRYHPRWLRASVSGGANALWLTEWLCEALDLRPGMRVLDLGCGRAASSIFLRREFGVEVWATDLWFSASENLQRVRDAGVEDGVFPLRADARALPFAEQFFDAIVSIDAFVYFGTDDLYLNQLCRLLRPEGLIGIAGAGLAQEMDGVLPAHLRSWWTPSAWSLHSASWWRRHWERAGAVSVEVADTLPGGWQFWRTWQEVVSPDNATEIAALSADRGRYLGYVRAAGRLRSPALLEEPVASIPAAYRRAPLLRDPSPSI
jgi:SAM-dependent methyltransferase